MQITIHEYDAIHLNMACCGKSIFTIREGIEVATDDAEVVSCGRVPRDIDRADAIERRVLQNARLAALSRARREKAGAW